MADPAKSGERTLRGIAVSQGVCRGPVLVLGRSEGEGIPRQNVSESEVPKQIERLEQAISKTRQQILNVQRQVSAGLGADDAMIFDAHLLVLEDPTLMEEVTRLIGQEKVTAEYAFHQVADKYARTLSSIDDEYLRERATDMRDVTARML